MTKEKALTLLINYVDRHREPEHDAVIYREENGNEWNHWTFIGLKTFILNN